MAGGTLQRARDALAHEDFRRLFGMRLLSQGADGLMQAALVASLAFSPERQTTAAGFAIATAVVIVPYSLVGPFAGVFIDRWRRKRIMVVAPLLRALPVFLLLADPSRDPIPYYAAALWITATNRFFLATAQAVVPRLVPTEDLLGANSIATVGGTVALLAGAFAGGLVADAFGLIWVVAAAAGMWLATSAVAASIRSDLRPLTLPESDDLLRHQLRRVGVEFADGIRILAGTPRAVGPIVTIGVDQVGQGLLLVIALVVFRERFGEGVGSFSWLLGAGGVGVFLGLATIGSLDERFDRGRIVAGAFVSGGISLLVTALVVTRWSVLLTSFAVGLTFAWKKVPIDTMVQEAVPDGVRGRVFSVYDVAYNLARLLAAFLAVVSLPTLGLAGSVAAIGGLFLLWAPALPAWLARAPEIRLRFAEGGRAEEWPLAVRWGGVEEPVEVLRSGLEDRPEGRFRTFRLSLADGSVLDVAAQEPDGTWEIERERIEG